MFLQNVQVLCVQNLRLEWDPKFSVSVKMKRYIQYVYSVGGYVRMAGDGLEEPPVQPGMNVKIKLNEQDEITHIILDININSKN